MNKLASKLQRFMTGRNGSDGLNIFLMILYFILFIINVFLKSQVLAIIEIVIILIWIFRFYSRRVGKRQTENAWFMRRMYKAKNFFNKITSIFKRKSLKPVKVVKQKKPKVKKPKTDKNHTFVTCPVCNSFIKVRRIKGERYVLCKTCHNEVKVKIK